MRTKILFVIDGMEFGGGERVFAQIINGLPEDRYEAFLATFPNDAFQKAITVKNCSFFSIDFSNRFNPAIMFRLIKIIKDHQIDIVHGQGARAEFYARLAAGLSGRKKYVSTVAMPVEGYDVGPTKRFLYKSLDRFSEKFVSYFLVVSSVLEQAMIRDHGIHREKVVKIYNGIENDEYKPNVEEFRSQESEVRREFELARDVPVIGAIGRLVWQKGFEYFLKSIPAMIKDIPKSRFVLVGDGPLKDKLKVKSEELKVEDKVIFTGFRSDIKEVLSAIDILVIPSLLEGFPMITLEAMAMEKPIVATSIDGITEQISDGIEGILIESKNASAISQAVKCLVDNPDYAHLLGRKAREKVVRDFSVNKMIAETIKVYESL